MLERGIFDMKSLGGPGRRYVFSLSDGGRQILETIDSVDKILDGDIAFGTITGLEVLPPEAVPAWVYDISVPGLENFIANTAVCHNSRFDLIFVMRDVPEPERDAKISQHILTLHREKSSGEAPPVPPEILKKYISYAKRISPALSDEAMNELREFYMKMRAASGANDAPVSITPRQLEALVRLAEARARAGLKDMVTVEDARQVIRLMNVCLENVGIDMKTGKVDIDVIMTGKPRSLRERMQIVLTKIAEIEKKSGYVDESQLYEALAEEKLMEEGEAKGVVNSLIREGLIYAPKPGTLRRTAV